MNKSRNEAARGVILQILVVEVNREVVPMILAGQMVEVCLL